MTIIWAQSAREARRHIIEFIAADNVLAALEMEDLLTAAVLRLEEFPQLGKSGRVDGTRELVVHEHYVIVYELMGDIIYILMILHTSRQWPPTAAISN